MPRTMIYDSLEEAANRLQGTVVTYEGQPVYVQSVEPHEDGVMRLNILEFPFNGRSTRKRIDSPHFRRFQTIPLGFANYFVGGRQNASWCERIAARQRRQGMADECFSGTELGTFNRLRFRDFYTSEAFREMVVGEYPAFDDAMARLVPASSIAVDREFALRMEEGGYVHLFHKQSEVGIFLRGNLLLRTDRQHLVESIVENPKLPNRVEVL